MLAVFLFVLGIYVGFQLNNLYRYVNINLLKQDVFRAGYAAAHRKLNVTFRLDEAHAEYETWNLRQKHGLDNDISGF